MYKSFPIWLFSLFLILTLQGCCPYRYPTESYEMWSDEIYNNLQCEGIDPHLVYINQYNALHSPLYDYIPRHRTQIRPYDIGHWCAWALFGNDDNGIFGETPERRYKYERPLTSQKAVSWFFRNPCHNFCNYVIGDANHRQTQIALVSLRTGHLDLFTCVDPPNNNFAGYGSSFFLGFNGCKPFVSLRLRYSHCRKTDIYLGWRNKGNFGIKCALFNEG